MKTILHIKENKDDFGMLEAFVSIVMPNRNLD